MKFQKLFVPVFLAMIVFAHGECLAECSQNHTSACSKIEKCFEFLKCNSGLYLGLNGGANFLHSSSKDHMQLHPNVGYAFGLEAGYRWDYGLRMEIEGVYRRNEVSYFTLLGSKIHSHKYVWSNSYFFNAIMEIPRLRCWSLTPYVGAGVGYTRQKVSSSSFDLSIEGTKNKFAYQVIAGVGRWLNSCSSIGLEYRYRNGGWSYLFDQSLQLAVKYHL